MKDNRRIVGPENSVPYSAYDKEQGQENLRKGDRKLEEHRKLFLKTGVISQAKGSAYIEQGGTKVMVGVYGPREVAHRRDFSMAGQLTASLKFAPFACLNRRGQQADQEEEELGLVLGEALASTVCLHRYPKAAIEVFVTVLEDDGSVLAASLTASGLALAQAGIHCFDIVVGATVCLTKAGLRIDPERGETYSPIGGGGCVNGELTVGFLPTLEQVVACVEEGRLTAEQLASCLAAATQQAAQLLPVSQQCLVAELKKKKQKEPQP